MKQTELITKVASIAGISRREAERILKITTDVIAAGLVEECEVALPGFGKLKASDTPARIGRNPATGQEFQIPAKRRVSFKASAALAEALAS